MRKVDRLEEVACRTIAEQRRRACREGVLEAPEFGRLFYGSMVSVCLVGVGNAGCTTLFNALSGRSEAASGFLFETRRASTARVDVPDEALAKLAAECNSRPARLRLSDGARADAVECVMAVLRAFRGDDVTHPSITVDPARDLEVLDAEMARRDAEALAARLQLAGEAGGSWESLEVECLRRACEWKKALRLGRWTDVEKQFLRKVKLLSDKPLVAIVNVETRAYLTRRDYDDSELRKRCVALGVQEVVYCSAELEARAFAEGYFEENPSHKLARSAVLTAPLRALDLITIYTAGRGECRAWLVRQGATVGDFARGSHEGVGRGFLLGEVVQYADWVEAAGDETLLRRRDQVRRYSADVILEDRQVVFLKFHM